MERFRPPPKLDFSGNISDISANWERFIDRFHLYLYAIGKCDASHAFKNAIFLTVAGREALRIYNTFTFGAGEMEDDVVKHTAVIKKFTEYCTPRTNEIFERFIFRSRVQKATEPMESFIDDVKRKIKTCNYGNMETMMIRDQIVFGCYDNKLKERLLQESSLDLAKAEMMCYASETVKRQMKSTTANMNNTRLSTTSNKCRDVGEGKSKPDKSSDNRIKDVNVTDDDVRKRRAVTGRRRSSTTPMSAIFDCRNCGTVHRGRAACPAQQKTMCPQKNICPKCNKFTRIPRGAC